MSHKNQVWIADETGEESYVIAQVATRSDTEV